MHINMKEWVQDILTSPARHVLPIMTYPGLSLVNKSIMDVINDGEAQALCIEALAKEYPSAAAVTIMDLSAEAEAFGSPIKYSDHEVPTVTAPIVDVEDLDSVTALKVPKVGDARTSVYIKAAEIATSHITDKPTFGGVIGPYSLAGRLIDMTEIMMQILLEPDTVHIVLDKCTEFLIEYCKSFKATGANGVIIAEPAAGLLSPESCTEFSSEYIKKIVDAVQDDHFMVMLHNCGNTVKLVPSLLSTGAMALHFGNAVDMKDILPQIPENILALGNIDPAGVFKHGSAEDMQQKTLELLTKTKDYKNFIISSGCDIPPGTPLENVNAFYNAVATFNKI